MTQTEALKALVHEMEYVLSCINENKVPFDGDDFHEALRLGKEALSQTENDKERCVGCEACIDTACGRDECPKGWPKAPQPEQEPVEWGVDWGHDGNSVSIIKRLAGGGIEVVGWEYAPHPPKRTWVGLTLEERKKIAYNTAEMQVARQIEEKLKEKNT